MARTSKRGASPDGDPKAAERQRILDAAEGIFAEGGFAAARMQDIAAAARTSLRSVYAVAKGKSKVFRALHQVRARDLLSRMEDALADDARDPSDSLMDVIAVVAGFLMDHPNFLRIHLRELRAWALDDPQHMLVAERHASDRLLERLFLRGIRAGTFHDEEPRLMVASLRALEQVHLAAWISRRDRISKRATIEAIQRHAQRLFCRGRERRL
jgi:AcrR family transcriptional regulator